MTTTQEMTKTVGLPRDGYSDWANECNGYLTTKNNFQGTAPAYKKVTTEFLKAQDVLYNPITQRYTDNQKESATVALEKE